MTPRLAPRAGFSLVEVIVSMTISSLAIAVFFGTVANMQKQHRMQRDQLMAEDALRSAEMILRTVLQAADADPYRTGLALLNPDPLAIGTFDNLRVKSDFNPADGDFADELEDVTVYVMADTLFVKWNATGSFQALAYPVSSIRFDYFDIGGTALTTVASVASATAVRITIKARESPVSSTIRSRTTWVFLQNRR